MVDGIIPIKITVRTRFLFFHFWIFLTSGWPPIVDRRSSKKRYYFGQPLVNQWSTNGRPVVDQPIVDRRSSIPYKDHSVWIQKLASCQYLTYIELYL